MENANAVRNRALVYHIAKRLSTKQNGITLSQPTKDEHGNIITNTQFVARDNELVVDLQSQTEEDVEDVTLEEVTSAVKHLKCNKAPGTDDIPIEQSL